MFRSVRFRFVPFRCRFYFLFSFFSSVYLFENRFYPCVWRAIGDAIRWHNENVIITIWNWKIIVILFDGRRCRLFFIARLDCIGFCFFILIWTSSSAAAATTKANKYRKIRWYEKQKNNWPSFQTKQLILSDLS